MSDTRHRGRAQRMVRTVYSPSNWQCYNIESYLFYVYYEKLSEELTENI